LEDSIVSTFEQRIQSLVSGLHDIPI